MSSEQVWHPTPPPRPSSSCHVPPSPPSRLYVGEGEKKNIKSKNSIEKGVKLWSRIEYLWGYYTSKGIFYSQKVRSRTISRLLMLVGRHQITGQRPCPYHMPQWFVTCYNILDMLVSMRRRKKVAKRMSNVASRWVEVKQILSMEVLQSKQHASLNLSSKASRTFNASANDNCPKEKDRGLLILYDNSHRTHWHNCRYWRSKWNDYSVMTIPWSLSRQVTSTISSLTDIVRK